MARAHRGFGQLRKLPSGRWQARFRQAGAVHTAPSTFAAKVDAEGWLAAERAAIANGTWLPPAERNRPTGPRTLAEYAKDWLTGRNLRPRTRDHYRYLLDRYIVPTLGTTPLARLDAAAIRAWHAGLPASTPTATAHAYQVLRTLLGSAVEDGLLPTNPAHLRGAGVTRRRHVIEPASLEQLATIAENMPEQYRLLVLLTAWCALRFGEATELRRSDADLRAGVLRVRRGVVYVGGEYIVGPPKSAAGVRDVAVPPHLLPALRTHLAEHVNRRDGLLFPAADGTSHLAKTTLNRHYYKAREAAGRQDLHWHDLRHTGAVLAAQSGATLAELMGRLGHSTPAMAIRYQHVAAGRDAELARRLSELAEGR